MDLTAPTTVRKDYEPEFGKLGLEEVRSELLRRRWDADKLAAARLWVETKDAERWLVRQDEVAPRAKPQWLRKVMIYVVIGFGVAYVAVRLITRWGG